MRSELRIEKTQNASADTAPLGAPEFAALMENFTPVASSRPIAVAVSGGPDSMALAFCIKRWLENTGRALQAFIVDHRLRDNSSVEAEQTKKTLTKIGAPVEILRWDHVPVVTRLHENARKARYRILIEACHRHGIADLMLAHQREDQAETVLMRLTKGSGIDGLCGMEAQSSRDGVQILRPFLTIPRARLIATCILGGLSFVSDPSNHSQKFARGRLRRVMPLLAAEGLTLDSLADLSARAQDVRDALDHATSLLLRVATTFDDAGVIRIDLEHMRSAPRAIAERALGICLQAVHPEDYMPRHASLLTLLTELGADKNMPPRTLHGCLIGKSQTHIWIMREYSVVTDSCPIQPGEEVVWDRRWRVSLSAKVREAFTIRPLGNPAYDRLDRLAPGLRHKIRQGRARASLPALWFNGQLALIPVLPRSNHSSDAKAVPVACWPPTGAW